MTYYEQIWNLPFESGTSKVLTTEQFHYGQGHQDARGQAAQIGHEADEELEKMQSECKDFKVELAETVGDLMSILGLLADIREACGDNGKRMQPELVEYIRDLKGKADADDNWWKGEGWYEGMEGVGELLSFTKFTSETSLTSGEYYDILTSDMDFPQKALLTYNGDLSLVAKGGIVNMCKVTHYKEII